MHTQTDGHFSIKNMLSSFDQTLKILQDIKTMLNKLVIGSSSMNVSFNLFHVFFLQNYTYTLQMFNLCTKSDFSSYSELISEFDIKSICIVDCYSKTICFSAQNIQDEIYDLTFFKNQIFEFALSKANNLLELTGKNIV